MTQAYVTLSFHTVPKWFRNAISLSLAVAALWVWVWIGGNASIQTRVLLSLAFALGAAGAQINQCVVINALTQQVERFITLWGLRLSRRSWPLPTFSGVDTYRISGGGVANETVHVGLRRSSGGFLDVRYFNVPQRGAPCPDADIFAAELSELTGLDYRGVA